MSLDATEFVLPVVARVGEGSRQRSVACLVDARIETTSKKELPVVARWRAGDDQYEHEFHVWNGGLVGPDMEIRLHRLTDRGRDDWRTAISNNDCMDLAHGPWSFWRGTTWATASEQVDDPDAYPEMRAAVDAALSRVRGSVVVDGKLRLPTEGPQAVLRSYHGNLVIIETEGPSQESMRIRGGASGWLWSAFDLDALTEAAKEHCSGTTLNASRPIVIGGAGWDIDAVIAPFEALVLQRLATSMQMKRLPIRKKDATEEQIEALVAVRELTELDHPSTVMDAVRRYIGVVEDVVGNSPSNYAMAGRSDCLAWRIMLSMVEQRAFVTAAKDTVGFLA